MKRPFDLFASTLGLALLTPLLFLVALAIKLDSRGPVFYRGQRVGKDGKLFRIFKFRTMVVDAARQGGGITFRDDPRITRVGRFLRRTKLDELPQLINVVKGEMSLVGPRPEDPNYIRLYTARQQQVLSLRPGITSLASLRYRHEEELLTPEDWEKIYIETILPSKLDIELSYLEKASFGQDLLVLVATFFTLIRGENKIESWTNTFAHFESFFARYVPWIAIDMVLIILAYVLALLVRSVNARIDFDVALLQAMGGVIIYLIFNYAFGIYHRVWRYASAQEAVSLFVATAGATALVSLLDLLMRERNLPLGSVWLGGFFAFCLLTATRYRRRLASGARQLLTGFIGLTSGHGARVLIVGAGEDGQLLAWQLQNRWQGEAYQVIGFVDTDPAKRGMRIHNVPVLGDRQQIPEIAAQFHPDLIVIALSAAQARNPRELLALCRATSAQVKILPGLFDWLGQNNAAPGWEDVTDVDLLERTPYRMDEAACRALLTNRVVLVTGAAGSIGSELCRQIVEYHPRRLVMVDINESALHDLVIELKTKDDAVPLELVLADITNAARMRFFFEHVRPQIIFHAAAYKHVPILETHPQEGIRVNVLGTRLLHSLAREFGTERFVLISSDKAVNPTNVLGMTKWLGELMVCENRPDSTMLSTAVRFGNVLGSRGSVLPTFEKQIELGGPITITDPEMTRYFLTISEAVSLVIQAAAMTRGGDLYVLDMGVPIRIMELAQRLIRARGLRPEKDIAIRVIGPRPGEKLAEELVADGEEKIETEHPSIFRIRRTHSLNLSQLGQQIELLLALSTDSATPATAIAALRRLVALLHPSLSAVPPQTPAKIGEVALARGDV